MQFTDAVETYSNVHDIEPEEVLRLWRSGALTVRDLLDADLTDEGIWGYTEHFFGLIQSLTRQAYQDHGRDPWL